MHTLYNPRPAMAHTIAQRHLVAQVDVRRRADVGSGRHDPGGAHAPLEQAHGWLKPER